MVEFVFRAESALKLYEEYQGKETLLQMELFPDETHIFYSKHPLTDDFESIVVKARKYEMIQKMFEMDDADTMQKFLEFRMLYWEDMVGGK